MKADCANRQAIVWLTGHWAFHRQISNGLAATGRAVFECQAPSTLEYYEAGTLSNGGEFTKRYRYSLVVHGIIVVHADPQNDGGPFQTLQFADAGDDEGHALCAQADNLCGADHYDSLYRLNTDRLWIRHIVKGPKKDYRIETAFQRSGAPKEKTLLKP